MSDLPPGHHRAEIKLLRYFGKRAETIDHMVIVICVWALFCHIHGHIYVMPFIPKELHETAPDLVAILHVLPHKPWQPTNFFSFKTRHDDFDFSSYNVWQPKVHAPEEKD